MTDRISIARVGLVAKRGLTAASGVLGELASWLAARALVAIAFMLVAFYMLHKSLELAFARLTALRQPVIGMASVGHMATVVRENRKAA